MATSPKNYILSNYRFMLYDESANRTILIKDEEEVQRLLESEELGDGDMVVEISKDNLRLAQKRDFIELV